MPRGQRGSHGWSRQSRENRSTTSNKKYTPRWKNGENDKTTLVSSSVDKPAVPETLIVKGDVEKIKSPSNAAGLMAVYSSVDKPAVPETLIVKGDVEKIKSPSNASGLMAPWLFDKANEEFHCNSTQVERTDGIPASNWASDPSAPTHGQNEAFNSATVASVSQNITQPLQVSSGLPSTKLSDTSLKHPISHSTLEVMELQQGGETCSNSSMSNPEHHPASNILTTCSEKAGALSYWPFLGLGMKVEGLPMKMSTPTSPPVPSWLAMFHRLREESPNSAGLGGTNKAISGELLQLLRLEINTEKHQRLQMEEQLQQEQEDWERERRHLTNERERLEREVQNEREERQRTEEQLRELQSCLQAQEHQLNELTITVTSAQRALDENRRSHSRDWVINRDEVRMSNKSLGVGGWGRVVEGTFRGTKVAVKQIHELILSPHNRRLFEREMNIASRCRHPCLLQFIGATNDDLSPLFITEQMEKSLRALLEERSLELREILVVSTDVARALNYLHLNRPTPIIHRDISSANVLLWRQGETWRGKVSDYGTANFVHQTMTEAPGAPPYSAPEAFTSTQSPKLDVYSFGVLLCEMITRELPVPQQREEQIALVTNHVLRDLVRRCVEQNPVARLTMEQTLSELETRFEAEANNH